MQNPYFTQVTVPDAHNEMIFALSLIPNVNTVASASADKVRRRRRNVNASVRSVYSYPNDKTVAAHQLTRWAYLPVMRSI